MKFILYVIETYSFLNSFIKIYFVSESGKKDSLTNDKRHCGVMYRKLDLEIYSNLCNSHRIFGCCVNSIMY